MKRNLLSLIACMVLAISLSACAGMSGMPEDIPSLGNTVTDVGNPNENEELMKGLYVNDAFDVTIRYPDNWTVTENGIVEAIFTAENGNSVTASFIAIDDDETLESFVIGYRGSLDGLVEREAPRFDEALCADNGDDGINKIVECYYFSDGPDVRFVMVLIGMVSVEDEGPTLIDVTAIENEKDSSTDGDGPSKTIELRDEAIDAPDVEDGPTYVEFKPIFKKLAPIKEDGVQRFSPFGPHD